MIPDKGGGVWDWAFEGEAQNDAKKDEPSSTINANKVEFSSIVETKWFAEEKDRGRVDDNRLSPSINSRLCVRGGCKQEGLSETGGESPYLHFWDRERADEK